MCVYIYICIYTLVLMKQNNERCFVSLIPEYNRSISIY